MSPFTCESLGTTVGTEGLTFVTTLGDMDRFLRGLLGGDLVSEAMLGEMVPSDGSGVGLGMWSETNEDTGLTVYGHFGSRRDFETVAYYDPESELSVIAFGTDGEYVGDLMWDALNCSLNGTP